MTASVSFAEPAHQNDIAPDEPAPTEPEPVPRADLPTGMTALPAGVASAPELGWAGAALTLNSVRVAGVPMVIELEVVGHPTILIDPRHEAYTWDLDLSWFPENPQSVRVSVDIVEPGAESAFPLPGKPLDTLLWKIGRAGFPDRLAPWLRDGDAYRLLRWPNLTALAPDADQIRQTAMLANGAFTIPQLAAYMGRSIEPTRTLVNALSLMGVLEVSTPEADPGPSVEESDEPTPPAEEGLFGRLRKRLGL